MGGRLHPAAIGVQAFARLVPLAVLIVASPVDLPFAVGLGAFALVGSAVTWYRFTWQLEDDALVIEQGLFARRRRVIPLGRIQSVETVRRVRHRVFGVVALRVETVGGDDTEGQLDALDPELATRLRRRLLRIDRHRTDRVADGGDVASHAASGSAEDSGEELLRLTPTQLVIAGLTGGRVGVAAVILGFGQQLWFDRVADARFVESVWEQATARRPAVIGSIVLVVLLVVFALSVLATALTFWNLTVTRSGANLRIRRGLLDERSDTVPLRRIQAVRLEENLLRRLFGLAAVKIEVAGRVGTGEQGRQTDVVLPAGSLATARRLADGLLGAEVTGAPLTPMPHAARTRRLFRAGLASLPLFVPGLVDARGWVALVLVVPFFGAALAGYRALGWGDTGSHLLARSGVLVRRTWIVPVTAVQSVAAVATPFQRRRDLGSVKLHIPRSGGADPVLHDVAAGDAAAITARAAAASTAAGREQIRARRARLHRRLAGADPGARGARGA